MLIVTEGARARISEELGPAGRPGEEPTALRLLFVNDGFELVPDRVQDRDVRFEYGGRTVLVVGVAIEEALAGAILQVSPSDPSRLRLIPINSRRRRRDGHAVTRWTLTSRRGGPGSGASRSPGPLRHRRVTRRADGAAIVERQRLTRSQMKVLSAVFLANELSIKELEQRSRLRRGSVRRITEGLQRRGLVEVQREKGPRGGGASVRITSSARAMLRRFT